MGCVYGTPIHGSRRDIPTTNGIANLKKGWLIRVEIVFHEPIAIELQNGFCATYGPAICQEIEDVHLRYAEVTANSMIVEADVLQDGEHDFGTLANTTIYIYQITQPNPIIPIILIGGVILALIVFG
ncbi:hypothetical protein ES702_00450 [subsurface metagenome]